MAQPGPRRRAREAALQVLFAVDVNSDLDVIGVERTFDEIVEEFSLPARARDRARELALGVAKNLKAIDESIESASAHWKIHRLATVDRNLLRVSAWELLFDSEIPHEIVIDEAVEIARRFSTHTSPAFVNGVLDMIWRSRQNREEGEG